MHGAIPFFLAASLITLPAPIAAQVTKPRTTPPERLPAPEKISAAQQPDGRIRVVWSSVDGAARYGLFRSVANVSNGPVALGNPSDTVYVESNVSAGQTYYYVVHAIGESGSIGLNRGAAPVTAKTREASDTASTPATTPVAIAPPTNLRAEPYPYPAVTLRWQSQQKGVRFLVDEAKISSAGQSPWASTLPGHNWACCQFTIGTDRHPAGTRLIYRLIAIDSVSPTNQSEPVISNEVTTYGISVLPPIIRATYVQAGSSISLLSSTFTNARLGGTHWVSLTEPVATTDAHGTVTGRAPGVAYIVVSGMTPEGAVQSFVHRIEVLSSQ